jgi:ankyrin repeat domain-containing protein 50
VDEADNDGKGALMLAAQEGHTKLVSLLIDEWGAPVDQRAHDGKTAFRFVGDGGVIIITSLLMSSLLGHRPSLWITH